MNTTPTGQDPLAEAEVQLDSSAPMEIPSRSAEQMLHELHVYQRELEMQNETLRQSQSTLEESRDRYVDFYDFAPSGYITLSSEGLISEINLTGANLLGKERGKLLNRRFASFVVQEDSDRWYQHFMAVRQNDRKHICELEIMRADGERLYVQLDSLRLLKEGKKPVVRIALTDITDRKLAEDALHKSENYLRLFEQREIIQTSLDGFFVVNTNNSRLLEVNDAFCNLVGYSRDELLTMRLSDLEAEESSAETAAHIKKIKEIGYDRFETCHRHKQGHLVSLEISVTHSELDGGIIFIFARDITERKLLEQQLRLKEFVLDHARDAVFLLDLDSRFIYVNEEACRSLGYSREELFGLALSDIDPDTTQEDFKRIWKQMSAKGHITFKTRHRRRDGSLFPVEIQSSLFEYQGKTMNMALARNITERKYAAQKVAELQHRNELILNTAGDGICGINKKGRINFINPAAAKMLGYGVEELYGLSLEEISRPPMLDGCNCPSANCQFLMSINGGTTCHKSEEIYRRKDGNTFPVSCTRAPIIDKGKCIGAVVMFRDITERKRSEQLVRELSMHLQNIREEEKANFAREIHDELGSTLTALKIEAGRLNRGLSAEQKAMPLFARVESMVDLLDDAVAATRRIITDLRPTMLDDLGLLAALEWQADQFQKRTGIECQVIGVLNDDLKDALDKIRSINLYRIFQEALANVARHSGASKVKVEFRYDDEEVFLSISDNGRGLPSDLHIVSTSYGLRSMRERVDQLGGKIKFDSAPGSGMSVAVTLPLPAAPQQ